MESSLKAEKTDLGIAKVLPLNDSEWPPEWPPPDPWWYAASLLLSPSMGDMPPSNIFEPLLALIAFSHDVVGANKCSELDPEVAVPVVVEGAAGGGIVSLIGSISSFLMAGGFLKNPPGILIWFHVKYFLGQLLELLLPGNTKESWHLRPCIS